jgi:hypothetical protein
MKLNDLFLSKDALDGLQGIEKDLQTRRYTGTRLSILFAALSVVLQIAHLLSPNLDLAKLAPFTKSIIVLKANVQKPPAAY